ncbi:uncharacterized protein LOC103939063 [Pyrus x bretschneideri]|uniref:uncharacterized protein LOC103939063 n=1 Tax=Pyrus x bretschneideri TaxID=225117 RepID=UPI0020306988|nr:uncharacterized protein LOC103939063 [Pyrus x bretschneideri]
MEDRRIQSRNSSMPLVSRLDHLDFIMKYLERNQKLGKLGSKKGSRSGARLKRQCLPMDLAMKETYFKGSLLNRVTALEHKFLQLCLEMEFSSSSSCTSTQTSGDTYWSHTSKGESSLSLPAFTTNPLQIHNERLSQVHSSRLEIEENPDRELLKQKPLSTCPAQQQQLIRKKNRTNKDEKSSKNGKKKISSSWPSWKLLGCSESTISLSSPLFGY